MVCDSPHAPTAPVIVVQRDDDERDREPDDTPETPLDEPAPSPVIEPPSEPEQKGPYVVNAW